MRSVERFRPKGHTIVADTFRCPHCGGRFLARKRRGTRLEGVWIWVCPPCKRIIRDAERARG